MKKVIPLLIFAATSAFLYSQPMHVKDPNFTSFHQDAKRVVPLLDQKSSTEAKQHPEYGVLPFNAQCSECVELIDERTISSRQFIDPQNARHTYSQQSYFPLHYKRSANDIWRTIDHRLRPDPSQPRLYTAPDQPVPTKCDLNKKTVSLNTGDLEFEFNKNLTMYFFDENTAYTKRESGNYSFYTIGEEGLLVKNIWTGIDLQQVFRAGEIETNYVINSPLQLPISKGWMVIEDHFTLPEGFTFQEAPNGEHVNHGEEVYYKGDYILKNAKDDSVIIYEKPLYVDAKAFGMHGNYKLLRTENDYTLQMFVPIDWLSNKENNYPLYIDPTVFGITKIGNFHANPANGFTGGPPANLAFTSIALGSCDYQMQVTVPGASQLTNAYVDVEYELTYDNSCGSPPEPAPYCTFSQVIQQVVCDTCGTSSGPLSCSPSLPPFTGTCTTNDSLVPGAHSILINTANPNFLSCIPPQCADYNITFTLKNQDSICNDVCQYLCARGNMWQMTVEANTVQVSITQDKAEICPGDSVTFTAHPLFGVAPYNYIWFNGSTQDTIYNSPNYTIYPQQNVIDLYCYAFSVCNSSLSTNFFSLGINYEESNFLNVAVSGPFASAGQDITLCKGGTATLGGNPTSNGNGAVWMGSDSLAQSWLSDTAALNPQITVPAGTTGAFFYVLTVNDTTCHSTDTVYVFSTDSVPAPAISVSGDTLISSVTNNNQWYLNDTIIVGANSQRYIMTGPGSYTVSIADSTGCSSAASAAVVYTGINDLTSNASVIIYPNPASTQLIITTSNFQAQWLTVYDLNGKKITEQKFVQKLDISKLSAGAYFIEIKGAGISIQRRLVKLSE